MTNLDTKYKLLLIMKIQLKPIYPLFVLYSALNYNGYDKENNPFGMHSVRKGVRDYLEKIKPAKFDFVYHPYQYTKQILTAKNFKPTGQTNPDFLKAIDYLSKFERQAQLNQLWHKVEKETIKDLKKYKDSIQIAVKEVEKNLDIKRPDTKIIFTVNLLESYKRGFSITLDKITYIITGPSEELNIGNFVHELIHSYLHDKDIKIKNIENHFFYQKIPEQLRKNYPPEIIIEESLVRVLAIYIKAKNKEIGEGELTKQDKELKFPELFFNQLKIIKPEKITLVELKKIVNCSLCGFTL